MTEHPNRFVLERYCVGDLVPVTRDETRAHLDKCATCKDRVTSFQEQAARDLVALPPAQFMANLSARKEASDRVARMRWWAGAGGMALAAAAAFALVPRSLDSVALRGTGMQVHRNRAGIPKLMDTNDRIRAGDALRVVITLPHPAPVDAWSIDATGRVDRLLAGGPMHLEGGERVLPNSAVVNAPCVNMWIVIGVGAAGAQAEPKLKSLGPHGTDVGDDWVPKGCLARPLRCE